MTRKPLVDGTDRGVSDVIAFTIVFGIIITSVGIVSVVGFQSLQEVERNEQGLNAQRAFQTVADNLAELQGGQTPARTSELDARDGTIWIEGGPPMTVTVEDDGSGSTLNTTSIADLGSLTYSIPTIERTIGIQSGSVFNAERSGSVMVEPPKFVCRNSGSDTSAIVSVLVLYPVDGAVGKSGGDVQIRATYNATSRLAYANTTGGPKDVFVEVGGSSQFGTAWSEGVSSSDGSGGWNAVTGTPPTVECQDVDDVIVRVTVANVELR